jgi:hypothetical protein
MSASAAASSDSLAAATRRVALFASRPLRVYLRRAAKVEAEFVMCMKIMVVQHDGVSYATSRAHTARQA